ncbi:MAG: LamG domain-containing protein [Lachnospiraceae bacterium]|nr:LamG domain-containing protein [Lachnospiraceae bacterium]
MKRKLLRILLCGVMTAGLLTGCGQATTEATDATGKENKAEAASTSNIPSDYKYYYSFDQADDNDGIVKVACEGDAAMVPVDREKNYIPGVKGEALYNDGIYGYDLKEVNGVGNSYTIAYWTYCQRSALYMSNTIWGPDIKGNKDIGAEQWAAFDWLASDDDSSLQVFPGLWSNEEAGVGRAEWKAAGSDTNTGHWMHLALVVDENSVSADDRLNIAKVYVNGQEVVKKKNGEVVPVNIVKTAMVPADSFEFLLGINYWDAGFKGAFDELYIYDYPLPPEQIAKLAADGDPAVAMEEPERVILPVAGKNYLTALGDLSLVAAEDQYTSDVYTLADGGSYKFILKNWSDGKESSDNYILKFAADGAKVATIYADATGSVADGTDLRNDFTYSWEDWNTWLTSVMMEASPVIYVSRDGSNVTVRCDNVDVYGTSGTNVATVTFDSGVDAKTPLELSFTNRNSYVEILEAKDTTPKPGGMIVGATDCSSDFFTEFSPIFSVPEGASVTRHFTNYTSGEKNWHNFLVVLQNTPSGHSTEQNPDYAEYAVVRADNYGWGTGYDGIVTPACDWNFDTFTSDMDGAEITATITNNGITADVSIVAETTAGKVYHQKYDGIKTGGNLYACFSLERAYLSFDTLTVGETDCSTEFWGAFSNIYAVPEGASKTVYFKNYNDGGTDQWHNFYVVLQNVPAGHDADANPDYAEYAVVRADNYGWGIGYDGIVTPACDWDWDTFMADTNGAFVELTVTNNGDTADVRTLVTSEDGKLYHQNYTDIKTGGDLYFCIGGEASYQMIEKQKVGASDCTAAFWGPFSDIVEVPEGETVYSSFVNYNDGGTDNWHNFYVVLQNTPAGHSEDEAEGYGEYAVLRADSYGWGSGYEGIVTPACDWDWATFIEDTNEAAVLLAVTNNGDTADVVAYVTTAAGKVYTQIYEGIKTGGDLYFSIGGEASYQLVD